MHLILIRKRDIPRDLFLFMINKIAHSGENTLKRILFFIYVLFIIAILVFIAQKIYLPPQLNQRRLFVHAEQALQNGQQDKFNKLKAKLVHYPLYPYLVYDDLSNRLSALPENEVKNYLAQYSDTAAAPELRHQWLLTLARAHKWPTFIQYYHHTKDAQVQCLYAQALYQTGKPLKAYQLGEKLWMTPRSQVKDCDALFAVMKENGALSDQLIWQRFLLITKYGKTDLAHYLAKQLPSNMQTQAKLWLIVKQNSNQIMNPLLFPPQNNTHNQIIAYGLQKMGDVNPNRAVKSWKSLKQDHNFSDEQVQKIIQAIAVGYIRKNHYHSVPWLHQINPKYLNNIAMNWRLRFALEDRNWRGLLHWINQLPAKEQKQSQWLYWRAQALQHLGKKAQADAILQQLAKKRDYYGFVAAEKLGLPYPIHNQQLSISDKDYQRVKNYPGFLRVNELFALQRNKEGVKEWWHVLKQLPESDRYIAARMANLNGWNQIALSTTGYIAHQDDLQLRFPQFYLSAVQKQANSYNLMPEFIYAIIRQESMFRPDAKSYAGAMGLMQLMPATANMLIQQDSLPQAYSNKLKEPEVNIKLGSQYLNRLLAANQQNIALTAAAYNAGPGRVRSWLPETGVIPTDIWVDTIPYPETRNYVKNVITYAIIYQYLMGGKPDINKMMPVVKPRSP